MTDELDDDVEITPDVFKLSHLDKLFGGESSFEILDDFLPENIKPDHVQYIIDHWLNYDQISLVPLAVSDIDHRSEVDLSVQLGPAKLSVPIIAAPMPDVCDGTMAASLGDLGALGIINRFMHSDELLKTHHSIQLEHYSFASIGRQVGVAVGVRDYGRFGDFYAQGCRIVCLDTANGANVLVEKAVKDLKDKYQDVFIIAGNVASGEAFAVLQLWGVDAIRVGIAGGSVCETRTETGVYSPMASAVNDCARFKSSALLIADGGINKPADACKALALGADVVMMGGALAGTAEAPGNVIVVDGKKYKLLRGAASFGVQQDSGTKPYYVEGRETLVPYRGPVAEVIDRYKRGMQSSFSYMGARNIKEFQGNVRIVRIG